MNRPGIADYNAVAPHSALGFGAEGHRTIDWPTKCVTLAGEVSVGDMRGARIEPTAGLIQDDLSGAVCLAPVTLAARCAR